MKPTEKKIAEAAFRVLAKNRWDALKLADVAKAAKIPLAALLREVSAKSALVGLMVRLTADETIRRHKRDGGSQTTHDRVFDVAMSWFEGQAPHKAAIRALYEGLKRDPFSLIAARVDVQSAGSILLALAEVDNGHASMKALGLALVVGRTIPVWLDDGRDLSGTMASLDADLCRANSLRIRAAGIFSSIVAR